MSATTHPHGFRIVGPCSGDRRRVDAAAAFQAYCHCDARAGVDREAYLSAFQFDAGFAEHLARTGSPAGFSGATWAPFVWLDVDREESAGGIARALADTKRLVDTLDERYAVPRAVLLPFVSGGKGFHVGIPTALWAPTASADFHAVARQFAETVAAAAGVTVDVSVFDRVRAFRAPNSRHPKSGLHKRFVPVEILDTVTVNGVRSLAAKPEPFDVPSTDGVASADMLVAVWDSAARAVAANAAAVEQRRQEVASGDRAVTVNKLTRAFLNGEVEAGDRHRLLYSAAANLAELGCPLPALLALLTEPALDTGLPPKDVARQIECGHAAAHPLVKHAAALFGGTVTNVEQSDLPGAT
ncbi:MAG: DNA primase [Planctomycetota bacterium]